MTKQFVYIEIYGGVINNIRHNLPIELTLITKTSDDNSLLDNSFTTNRYMPSLTAELAADIAYSVRALAAGYNLPGWNDHTDAEITNKLLNEVYDLDPCRLTYSISAAIPALQAGYPVFIDDMPVADIERGQDGVYDIYCLPDPDFRGAGIIKQSPGDFHPDDEVFTIIRTVEEPDDEDAGDDMCDICMRSGVQITHTTDDGLTICAPIVWTPPPRHAASRSPASGKITTGTRPSTSSTWRPARTNPPRRKS